MSDRLTELQRQRALAQEQVAWFDREIARESGETLKPLEPVGAAPAGATVPGGVHSPRLTPALNPDELLKQYQGKSGNIRSEVKRGCLIYFFAAFALLALAIAVFAFFWAKKRDETPLSWNEGTPASDH